jgi:thioredoxin-like negative regulator of GroEL
MLCLSQENELASKKRFQALYFYSAQEPFHCKILIMLDKIEKKYATIDVFSIDTNHFKGLIKRFNINSIPTVVIFENFKALTKLENRIHTTDFIATFDDICSS